MAGPPVGVVVGSLVSFYTALGLELRRRRFERQEELASIERDSLSAALEWIDPMRDAWTRAFTVVSAAMRGYERAGAVSPRGARAADAGAGAHG